MNKYFLITTLLFTSICLAQMPHRGGMMQQQPQAPHANKMKQEKKDPIEQSLMTLNKELKLDDFQAAAVKSFLEEHQKESSKIIASNISDGQKGVQLQRQRDKLNEEIRRILNPDQISAFDAFLVKMDPNNQSKKTKKKKKKKGATESTDEPITE